MNSHAHEIDTNSEPRFPGDESPQCGHKIAFKFLDAYAPYNKYAEQLANLIADIQPPEIRFEHSEHGTIGIEFHENADRFMTKFLNTIKTVTEQAAIQMTVEHLKDGAPALTETYTVKPKQANVSSFSLHESFRSMRFHIDFSILEKTSDALLPADSTAETVKNVAGAILDGQY